MLSDWFFNDKYWDQTKSLYLSQEKNLEMIVSIMRQQNYKEHGLFNSCSSWNSWGAVSWPRASRFEGSQTQTWIAGPSVTAALSVLMCHQHMWHIPLRASFHCEQSSLWEWKSSPFTEPCWLSNGSLFLNCKMEVLLVSTSESWVA